MIGIIKGLAAGVISLSILGVSPTDTPARSGRDSFGCERKEGEKGCPGCHYEKGDGAKKGPLKDCMQQTPDE